MAVDFKAKQLEFAAYIRDPENNPAPSDVKKPRMALYRELFFNNIEGFLADGFPVLKKILTSQQWEALVQDFYSSHQSKSPYFSEISEEFLDYLENERDSSKDYPFLLELAHYEWVELALSISREELLATSRSTANLLKQNIQLSPLAWPLVYQYPVQKIAPEFLPEQAPAQPTFLICYRDHQYQVNFLEITPMTYRLLQIIQENESLLTEDCLNRVAKELNHPYPEIILSGGLQVLSELVDKSIVLISD